MMKDELEDLGVGEVDGFPRCQFPGCGKLFTTTANLRQHVTKRHWKGAALASFKKQLRVKKIKKKRRR